MEKSPKKIKLLSATINNSDYKTNINSIFLKPKDEIKNYILNSKDNNFFLQMVLQIMF